MLTVVAPWLEGGGAQQALAGLLDEVQPESARLVLLFSGSRSHESLLDKFDEVERLDLPRTALGAWRASYAVSRLIPAEGPVLSLMRASHVVLGLAPRVRQLQGRLVTWFHMLPSSDANGMVAKVENIAIQRCLRASVLAAAPSRRAVKELEEGLARKGPEVRYAPNLLSRRISDDRRSTAPRQPNSGTVRLVFLGRLEEQKGLDRLPGLLTTDLAVPVHLRIAGEGPEAARLSAIAAAVPSPHRVELIGRIDDVVSLLDWGDALFLPSREELNPVSAWESWSRERPVIAADLPVFRDLQQEGPLLIFSGRQQFERCLQALPLVRPTWPSAQDGAPNALIEVLRKLEGK